MVGESTFKKFYWIILVAFIAATGYLGYRVIDVRFDYDFEKFFPSGDPDTEFFNEFRNTFSSENDFLLIVVENEKGVFQADFLKKVATVTDQLEEVPEVEHVISITNQNEAFVFGSGFVEEKPYIDFNDFDAPRDSARIFQKHELINTLISEKGGSICIYLKHTDLLSKVKSDNLINDVEKVMNKVQFDQVRIGGRALQQKYYIDKMMIELIFFVGMSAVLIVIFLAIAFRSLWGILLPQVIIVASMLWVMGGMAVFDTPMSIILTVLPTIMFVVAMSDVIHLVSRYLDALRTSERTFDAITVAVKEVGLATLLTSVTTSIGFFSLYFVNIEPIQVFGIVLGCGVLLAFVLTFAIMPIMFYLFPGPKYVRTKKKEHFWGKFLRSSFVFLIHRPKGVLIIAGIAILASGVGAYFIRSNNYILDDLKPSEQLKQDFNFIDAKYGGVRPFELVVTLKDTSESIWSVENLEKLDRVEDYLEDTYGVTVKTSLVTALKVANRSSHAGKSEFYRLPTSKSKIRSYRRNLKVIQQGEFLSQILDSTERITRISGNLPDLGNIIVTNKNEEFYNFLKKEGYTSTLEFKLTGTPHLIDKHLTYLSVSLIKGLAVSILIVALIIGLIYRSFTIILISMITNIIPLIFIAGLMGYLGIELKTSTSIIFTIAFGIAVDDTIHFLGKFKHELLKGKSKIYALKRSYLTTGKAMILTTLILCSGFLLLIFSSFLGTFYLGLLLCITLFVALIADLTILPVLLLLFYKKRK